MAKVGATRAIVQTCGEHYTSFSGGAHQSKHMIRVAHLSTGLNPGGAERQLLKLVQGSDHRYFHHVVVSMVDVGPVGAALAAAGNEVHALGMRRGVASPAGLFRLVKLLRRFRPHLLQCWMYHANLLGLLAGRLGSVPVLWGIRSSDLDFTQYRRLTSWVAWLCARLSRFPDCIVANSEAGRRLHKTWGYEASKMVLIPNGFDLQAFKPDSDARRSVRQELGIGDDSVLIGLIGRFDPMKDHATFLEAASLLTRRQPRVHFLLAGLGVDVENSELSRMIRDNGLKTSVRLLGPRDDVARLNAALDIACSSSAFGEGFSNAIGEAMACGVPCVVTDVGDSAHIVGDTGRVVPPRNPEALAAAWADLIEMAPAERNALGQRARKRIKENFPMEKVVRSYEDLYRRLCPPPPILSG